MKKLKFIIAVFLCAIQFQCIHYFAKDTTEFNLTDEETKILQSKKFGLVGFRRVVRQRLDAFSNPITLDENRLRFIRFLQNSKNTEPSLSINTDPFPFEQSNIRVFRGKQDRRTKRVFAIESTNEKYFPLGKKIITENII